jgi:amino acid adenylation domain-containing protein
MDPERAITPQVSCIHETFERVVGTRPSHTAVVCGNEQWSYERLNAESNRIAHELIAIGLSREEPVAIALPRSCAHIAAMLGVLKAGGAYVPIVDNQPVPRLRAMLKDCQARFMLGQQDHLLELRDQVDQVITLEQCDANPATNPCRESRASDLAYILYTSGSTGAPKGVMIEHDGVHRLVHDQWFMPTGPDTNYLCVSSFGFDASTIEVYAALLHGATLVMTERRVPEPDEVRSLIQEHDVRAAWIAFGFLSALFESDPGMFNPLEVIMTGGEPVHAELIRRAQAILPDTKFVNSYGPTECTALSTAYEVPLLDMSATGVLPIGTALRDMDCCVVGDQGEPVPPGEPGELLISGSGITRGYLNAPEQTQQRLNSDEHGRRTFRSGDRVQMAPDGQLLFLGRIDEQVKIRGNRFELGEVEAIARQHAQVEECVACILERADDQDLGLLFTCSNGRVDLQSIKSSVASALPEYMVPSYVLQTERIPLTRNGKVDRAAASRQLRSQPDYHDGQSIQGYFATKTERKLAQLMSDVLSVSVNDRADMFLNLGGHSLRALVLCARVADHFGVRLMISEIYELASVELLACRIDAIMEQSHSKIQRIDPGPAGEPAPLSFNQLRLWMHDQLHPGDPSYTITIRLEHRGPLDQRAFERAWACVCDRHAVLRSRIELIEDEPCMILDHGLGVTPEWAAYEDETDELLDAVIERASMRGFDLESGPLVRCRVLTHHRGASIAITMHHIISDAWSCSVLQRELCDLYTSQLAGEDLALDPLPIQYADFARWERTLPDTPSYKSDLEAWCGVLRGAPELRLPADHAVFGAGSGAGVQHDVVLEHGDTERIRKAAQSIGVTPFVYLLSVFKAWLARLTLMDDIVVGSPIANRHSGETQSLIGFFMETLPLRNHVEMNRTLAELVNRVNTNTMDAFNRRDVPFQHIVQALGLQGQSDHNPLFDVFFNHVAIPLRDQSDSRDALFFSDREIQNNTAKFDLTCYVFEEDGQARVVFNARRSRFSSHTVRWYLKQFVSMLIASPDCLDERLSEIPIDLAPIRSSNPAKIPAPELPPETSTDGDILARLERVVEQHPRGIAVRSIRDSVRYNELWSRAGAVAAHLQSIGVVKSDRVLIATENPIDTCIASLGILRCGGVFVPTDSHWPAQRLKQISAAAGVVATVCSKPNNPDDDSCPSIVLTDMRELSEPERVGLCPGDPAYLMFTSGSTGRPKGVLQTHRGVVGHMTTFAHSLGLERADRLLQLSSFAFDASIMDMFACWLTGATLCVADPRADEPKSIADFVCSQSVSVLHCAPSLFRWFTAEQGDEQTLDQIRAVVLGGEHATDHDIDTIQRLFPGCDRLISGFGLTESSLNLQYRIDPNTPSDWPSRLPIGYPVEGVRARLVDQHGKPAFPTGEIEIESDRIAMQYTNPDMPIGEAQDGEPVKRFRTGDLGTIRHDGSIMHLGRIDEQVQIRGCRVEPSEVEFVIRSIEGINDAAVVVHDRGSHEAQLVAYVVCDHDKDQGTLRNLCVQRLPQYMVPDAWHRIDSIPRVGGGKVDRAALMRSSAELFANSTPEEIENPVDNHTRRVMNAFERVLGVASVGPDDNFFHCGGNSLRAIQLFSQLRETLQREIPISVIYRAPTPRTLGREYSAHQEPGKRSLIELSARDAGQRVLVLPGIGGHPLGFGPLIDQAQTPARFVGVQYPEEPVLDDIGRTLPALARWVIAQLELQRHDPIPDMIGYSFGGSLAMEIAMQLRQDGHPFGKLLLLDAHLPFGLPQRSRFGKARVHLARIVEGHETSRLGYVAQRLRSRRSGQAEEISREDGLDAYRAVSRIARQMVLEYRPVSRYDGEIMLVRAHQPDWLRFHDDDGYNGFSRLVGPERIELVEVNAGHLELFQPGPVREIARIVDRWISNCS